MTALKTPGLDAIGLRIRARRKALKLSQTTLAELSGASQSAITQWETSPVIPQTDYLTGLATALQVPLEWLITGAGSPDEYVDTILEPLQPRVQALTARSRDKSVSLAGQRRSGLPARLSPIKLAFVATVLKVLDDDIMSDTDCVGELPRWHELASRGAAHTTVKKITDESRRDD